MVPAVIFVIAFMTGMVGLEAKAGETGANSTFDEHPVEFRNQDVKLAGSLLLPKATPLFWPLSWFMVQANKLASGTVRRVGFSRARESRH